MILTEKTIYKLHQKLGLEKCGEKIVDIVWIHSQIVKEIALQIATDLENKYQIKTNKKLIEIGSLIHDIGCYDYFDKDFNVSKNYISHGKTGYNILNKNKYSEEICRFALVHIGVGIEDMIPITLEEEIVAFADNFHSKKPVSFNTYEESKKKLESFEQNKGIILDRYKAKFEIPNLDKIKEKYEKWHKETNKWIDEIKIVR